MLNGDDGDDGGSPYRTCESVKKQQMTLTGLWVELPPSSPSSPLT